MQIKKLLALFLTLALAVGLAGCGVETENGERPPDTPSGAVISEVLTDPVIQMAVEKMESKSETSFEITSWTMNDLVTDMEIAGATISMPCTVSDFNEKFNVDDIWYSDSKNTTFISLYLDDNYIGMLCVSGKLKSKSDFAKSNVYMISLNNSEGVLTNFNIMGITNESNRKEVLEILGESNTRDIGEKYTLRYMFSKYETITIGFSKEDTIESFGIFYNLES